jgi:hypothetical protein
VVGRSYSQSFSVTNTGTGNVAITQVAYTDEGFSVSGSGGTITLALAKTPSFSATFAPAVVGNALGTLTVLSCATISPAIVLTGTGVQPMIAVAPPA